MTSILRVLDPQTKTWKEIPAIKGDKGDPFVYSDFTPDQLAGLKGDTGAEGKPGKNGIPGIPGAIGKSAYQYAVDGGYTGTEAQFKTEQAGIANNSTRLTVVEQNKQDKPIAGQTFLTPLFVARGAVFNQTTGYYELNGLTDITEAEMSRIYSVSANAMPGNCNGLFSGSNVKTRTVYPIISTIVPVNASSLCWVNKDIETFYTPMFRLSTIAYAFEGCQKLREVGTLDIDTISSEKDVHYAFARCTSLQTLYLYALKTNINLSGVPLLSRESILYLINNSLNTTPITVTLHPDALARLTEADIALASSKNITLAI